jgi:hypothetical protein
MQYVFRVLAVSSLACAALAIRADEKSADAASAGSQRILQAVAASAGAGAEDMPVSRPVAMLIGMVAAAAFMSVRRRGR